MNYKYPLATSTWDEKEYQSLRRVMDSKIFSMGSEVKKFEKEFAEFFNSKYAVMVNSGSSANLLMTAALFYNKNPDLLLKPGDEIIVPAVSWSTTYFPLFQYGLRLKFVDIDLQTLNYDISALSEAVTDNTRAIMVVNLLGNPNDFDAINDIISDRSIIVIEDNCESMGATFNGRHAGTFGVMGSFSTFFSHHISTMEGGVVVTDDEELYHVMLSMRAHGWTRNLPDQNHVTGNKNEDPFDESFRFVLPGYNLRPLEMSGALGSDQIEKLPDIISGRRANGLKLQQELGNHPGFLIQEEIGESSWFGFSLVLRPGANKSRKELKTQLEELGFECRPIVAGNFTKNEVMKYFEYDVFGSLDNADYIDKNGLFLGNHHYSMDEAIQVLKSIE